MNFTINNQPGFHLIKKTNEVELSMNLRKHGWDGEKDGFGSVGCWNFYSIKKDGKKVILLKTEFDARDPNAFTHYWNSDYAFVRDERNPHFFPLIQETN